MCTFGVLLYPSSLSRPFLCILLGPSLLPGGAGRAPQLERGGPALQGVLHGQRPRPGGLGAAHPGGALLDQALRAEGDRVQLHVHPGVRDIERGEGGRGDRLARPGRKKLK